MINHCLLTAWLSIAGLDSAALTDLSGASILPLRDVRPGQVGVGRTVFTGGRLEEFHVEVLGVIENSTPRHSTILARLTGGPLAETGVIAGMSGSPVWIDGRLVGAVSSTYLFSKAPIAGITPIEDMLAIPARAWNEPGEKPAWLAAPGSAMEQVRAIERGEPVSPVEAARPLFAAAASLGPGGIPVVLSGFGLTSPAAEMLRGFGLVPMAGGSAGGSPASASHDASADSHFEPGSPIAVQLLTGDFQVSAVGTVTAQEGDRVLGFGHPLFGAGSVSFPIATADVVAVIPSVMSSFKIATVGRTVGALEQDRASGILGRLGGKAEMVPVRLGIQRGATPLVDYTFAAATHRLLTPLLLNMALDGAFSASEKQVGASTVDLRGRIEIAGYPAVEIDQFFSGDQAAASASRLVAAIVGVLLGNEFEAARITGLNLALGYREENLTAVLDRVWVDRVRVRPGESLSVKAFLRQARGGLQSLRMSLEVPRETAPGPLELVVGDAAAMARFDSRTQRAAPRSLGQLIDLLNDLRSSSGIYALLSRPDAGVAVRGEKLTALPPTVYALLAGGDGADTLTPVRRVTLDERDADTPFQVSGVKTLKLMVEAPRE